MKAKDIHDGMILRGSLFPEPIEVITIIPMNDSIKLIATGVDTSKTYQPILSEAQIENLVAAPTTEPVAGFKAIRWKGEVPALKWMNFYTKVVSKYASGKGVSLKVEPDEGISPQKLLETKAALKDLGLDASDFEER